MKVFATIANALWFQKINKIKHRGKIKMNLETLLEKLYEKEEILSVDIELPSNNRMHFPYSDVTSINDEPTYVDLIFRNEIVIHILKKNINNITETESELIVQCGNEKYYFNCEN